MSKDITREITVYAGKKRPKKDRPAAPIVREKAPGTPTPERAAKEPTWVDDAGKTIEKKFTESEVVPGNVYQEAHVAHKVQLAVDVYRRHFNQDELQAAEMFYRDIQAAMSMMVTANYDGGARSNPGPRAGGVSDHLRERYIRSREVLKRLTPGDKRALLALVIGLRSELTGRAASVQDIARERGAGYTSKEALAQVSVGLLKAALEHTFEAYRLYQLESRSSRKLTATEESNRAKALSSVRPEAKGPR